MVAKGCITDATFKRLRKVASAFCDWTYNNVINIKGFPNLPVRLFIRTCQWH